MKTVFSILSALLLLLTTPVAHSAGTNKSFAENNTDTISINHQFDGQTSEWPASVFETDKETGIRFAAHNDASSFYIAMEIPNQAMQMKMMRMGASFYIDLKGKKKENTGIEFPIKKEMRGNYAANTNMRQTSGNHTDNDAQSRPDPKAMRMALAINLIKLKLFGFSDDEPKEQVLLVDGSANIAFSWDSSDVMHIEYRIPLTMIDKPASLQNKLVSYGWKINGVQTPASPGAAVPPGRGSRMPAGGSRLGSSNIPNQADMEKIMQEQSFWSKYTFIL